MGNCTCVQNPEDQPTFTMLEPGLKVEQEVYEGPKEVQMTLEQPEPIFQALVRSYFDRKAFFENKINSISKSQKQSNSKDNLSDIGNILSPELIQMIKELDITEINATLFKQMPDGSYYSGKLKKGLKSGKGDQILPDQSFFRGTFANDQFEGPGLLLTLTGDIYKGNFSGGKFSGEGELTNKFKKYSYKGQWLNGKQHGPGTEHWEDDAVCEANFIEGVKSGPGTVVWPDGSKYQGNFEESRLEGRGEYIWADGRCYCGTWKLGKMNGKGKFTWPDGRWYEGDYVMDKKEGNGTFFWPSGKKYVGGWKNGKQHGVATLAEPGKKDKKGEWKNGTRIKWIE